MKAIKHPESHLVTFIQFLQKLNKIIESGRDMNFALLPLYDLCGFCLRQDSCLTIYILLFTHII